MEAIQTRYKGCHFRSRLEARWAVFFDYMDIKWEYEPEGFELSRDEEESCTPYLPDFFLPDTKTWVEVKGTNEAMLKMAKEKRFEWTLDFTSNLPYMADSYCEEEDRCAGLLLLGPIPYIEKTEIALHPIIQHHKGLVRSWVSFLPLPTSPHLVREDETYHFERPCPEAKSIQWRRWDAEEWGVTNDSFWDIDPLILHQGEWHTTCIQAGYIRARSARFEFLEENIRQATRL